MPVAVQSFTADYGDDYVEIAAGEWVCAGHELARRFPQRFHPDTSSPAHRATAWRVGGSALVSPSRPAVGARELRYTVEFTRSAWEELDMALGEWDGCEVGGGLFGQVSGDRIVVECVGRQAWMRDRTPSQTEIPVCGNVELARSLGLTWVGDWHVEPGEVSGAPSPTDEHAWTGLRGGGDVWLGVIVTHGPDENWPFCDPRLHAWTVGEQGLRAASLQQRSY